MPFMIRIFNIDNAPVFQTYLQANENIKLKIEFFTFGFFGRSKSKSLFLFIVAVGRIHRLFFRLVSLPYLC